MGKITAFLYKIRQRQDLALIGILLTSVIVMIIPMPTYMIDALIAFNISLTVLILIVAVYLDRPTSFSTFPAIILIATTFRLAISIATTRTILTTAEGGHIIETFANFVTGGNIVVGLVIFLIITIVQFLVITKGAERVAEVAARFVLDALPGRQLSIDAEMRAGDLTPEEARRRRRQLDKENQFFGAMDGAMKFVKGDAIAGLLIIAVNIIGGIAIGAAQHNMSIGQAAHTFALLSIGDGLVAQIPALLLALCAGAVVTRVSTDESVDLGKDIANELTGSSRTMLVAGGVVAAIGLVPGFPTVLFLIFGGLLAFIGYRADKRQEAADQIVLDAKAVDDAKTLSNAIQDIDAGETAKPKSGERFIIRVGTGLMARIDEGLFVTERDAGRTKLAQKMGFSVLRFGLLLDETLSEHALAIDLDQVPLFTGTIPPDAIGIECDRPIIEINQIAHMALPNSWRLRRVVFARDIDRARLMELGIPVLEPAQLLSRLALRLLQDQAGQMVSYDDLQRILEQARKEAPQVADQLGQSMAISIINDVLRRLIDEKVPLLPMRGWLEALNDYAGREKDPVILTEYARRGLRRQICHAMADKNRMIAAYVIEPDLETALRGAIKSTEAGMVMILPGALANSFLALLEKVTKTADPFAPPAAILTAVDLRRHVHAYMRSHQMSVPVLSFQELAGEFQVQPVGTLSLGAGGITTLKAA
jgi:type III secretion protein V